MASSNSRSRASGERWAEGVRQQARCLLESASGLSSTSSAPLNAARRVTKGIAMQHRAIETRYKGYRFRSRLEARWAIVFDGLQIPWEYEPEGFELEGRLRYLPDFRFRARSHIPDWSCFWVEIKALPPTEIELLKMQRLSRAEHSMGLVLAGSPDMATFWECSKGDEFYSRGDWWHTTTIQECRREMSTARRRQSWKPEEAIQHAISARFEFGEDGTRA